MSSEEKERVIVNMEKYGGSFVQALAVCFRKADMFNFAKLKIAFPEYWEKYSLIMKLNHKQKIKLARAMRTRREILHHIPMFETASWWRRYKRKMKKGLTQWGVEINQPIN